MATKSFLSSEERELAREILKPPTHRPDGNERLRDQFDFRTTSIFLSDKLLKRLSSQPRWLEAEPVALGSWARGELSPKSDIDLLFCGDEGAVSEVVGSLSRSGLKIRYRMPEDPEDWTKGVEAFDVLALLNAIPFSSESERKLLVQQQKLLARVPRFRRELLKAMRDERKSRALRYDSISNFLEPNIKFGPGGLRDLEQALVTKRLFPERFSAGDHEHAFRVLEYYKSFFLLVRAKLHLSDGGGDILSAPEQRPIAEWFGHSEPKEFMREIQKGLSRVSFYADWVIEHASAKKSRLSDILARKLTSVDSLFEALEEDPSILMQNRVRLAADRIFAETDQGPHGLRKWGRWLGRFLDPLFPEEPMVAMFRSRLIDHVVPEFRRIVGHVQHDQYHRFTVDAHLLQVLREYKRIVKTPNRAGRLARLVRHLSSDEREVLAFTCLYHDLAKGQGGDHSLKGVELARRDLKRFALKPAVIDEVCWLVEEHLALSVAAFRENPRSPRTWRQLADHGVTDRRVGLLALFTIVDIRGTNPEAWTPWKERLLSELVQQLELPETDQLLGLADRLRRSHVTGWERYLETFDSFLTSSIPAKSLAEDVTRVHRIMQDPQGREIPVRVVRTRGGNQTWVRFHARQDRAGLFFNFVSRLSASGLSIRHASILTDQDLGVYDWFEVKTTKSPQQIQKVLELATPASERRYAVRFDSIELVSSDRHEWVIGFRGRDQSGALAEAARGLFESGAQIRWAKVHTWGRQMDDIFGVIPVSGTDANKIVERLQRRFNSDGSKV